METSQREEGAELRELETPAMAGAPKVYPLLKKPEFQPESASERLALAQGSLVGREKAFCRQ